MKKVTDPEFRKYGRVLDIKIPDLLERLGKTPVTEGGVYVASEPELEACAELEAIQNSVFGGLPIQIGYCNGSNHKLNGLEYHRDSEVNVAVTDLILLLGREQDIDPETFAYDSSKIEAFLVPAGTCIEVYATTLHFAPCNAGGPFRCVVVLPRGTNEKLTANVKREGETRLLTAVNKWLIAHPDTGMDKMGVVCSIQGENITL